MISFHKVLNGAGEGTGKRGKRHEVLEKPQPESLFGFPLPNNGFGSSTADP
jgi:hypothetical protein